MWSPFVASILVGRYGETINKEYGVGRLKQFFGLTCLAIRYNTNMDLYYRLRLFELECWEDAALYLDEEEVTWLLSRQGEKSKAETVDNKITFHSECQRYNLPVSSVYAYFNNSSEQWFNSPAGTISEEDLFVKWTDLNCGQGAILLKYCEPEALWRINGRSFRLHELIKYFRERSRIRPLMVQPRLRNHAKLEKLSPSGLSTIRVVTLLTTDGGFEVISTGLRMPAGDSIVDNLSAGGLAAPIDLETGIASAGRFKDIRKGVWQRHPDTYEVIEGLKIPRWKEVISLCKRAHECFVEPFFIGWDVVVEPEGLSLLEANSVWGAELAQMSLSGPIGLTCFADEYIKLRRIQQDKSNGV